MWDSEAFQSPTTAQTQTLGASRFKNILMTKHNPWDKIFVGDFDSAFDLADENYRTGQSNFDLRARALILLHQRKYQEAIDDFKILMEKEKKDNRVSDDTYLYIGLCYYALDLISDSRNYFEYPIKHHKEFKYTTDISLAPAILLFFSLKTNDTQLLVRAEKDLLKRKTPIAEYLTDRISEREFKKEFVDVDLKERRECRFEFYKGLKYLRGKEELKYFDHLRNCKKIKGKYLEYEYYLSKIELEKLKE
jgi:hypothetical protein